MLQSSVSLARSAGFALLRICFQQAGKRTALPGNVSDSLDPDQNGEAIVIKNNEAIQVLTHPVLAASLVSVTWDTKALSQQIAAKQGDSTPTPHSA